ncbi:hypothetical protein HDV00_003369 [Rhizophlyctis rosea]|nr:hypothetical protein HDV00_003369 [Rhizophlyctis rosea]
MKGLVDVVQTLLEAGGGSFWGLRGLLSDAAFHGHVGVVRLLLESDDHDSSDLICATGKAACNGHADIVKQLLKAGADVRDPGTGYALAVAEAGKHHKVVEVLLAAGVEACEVMDVIGGFGLAA